ncbi:lipolytic enzyme [Ameyamaea chiangmaiensis NBRC 103196]|uniref:SGNH/GDSL hydrolase family protein n=1 Tax=Ameyamaea chiangmaiensis TaxID=442969 RepID=A0A850PFR8_9PROT|nr:SGNH/GDSL hydrolase family protein [Ameyamaea chiangmaiensis]MBS4074787.1 SGNH/GDSL hydrolase family protein [Ameyamaea chiangmaiensis]NVN41683.1 SGNH/GDSL hydrolase family protein [Ameyamaea chiangmaiensis]GBQ62737.1 lipolytic enzyme [Ameyamaea chiangmaiensis NBRC 103196]
MTPPTSVRPLPRLAARIRARAPVRITLFGSSTTEGIGASSPEHGYAAVLERSLRPHIAGSLTVINRGVGGDGAAEMHRRLPDVLADDADLVVWQGGTNDVSQKIGVESFVACSRQDLAALRDAGADIALVGQQWCRAMDEEPAFPDYRHAVEALAGALGAPYFPRFAIMHHWCEARGMTRDEMSPDGLHMNDVGYALLGEAVAHWLIACAETVR